MPFYKWIIETGRSSERKEPVFSAVKEDKCDVNAIANKRMVKVIQHLSQLARIASDIFGSIDDECVSIFNRTNKLREQIETCQGIVDNLNAKTVLVPVSTLSSKQVPGPIFVSGHADETSPIFSAFPRPPEVDRLRQLASGPSPPAIIPSSKIADGEPKTSSTTHIYCQPLRVQSLSSSNSIMTSNIKMPSSVVPIDVSGQPFSRMASFRRSLIHVDFFIRRKKKKDKRRNTVTEGDTKDLKDVLHNIINEKSLCPVVSNLKFEKKNSNHENDHNTKQDENNKMNKILIEEKNNNSSGENICTVPISRNCIKPDTNSEEKNEMNISKNESVKLDLKNHYNSEVTKSSALTKRKSKGHIPISTVSAAMSVAVEMRQLNVKTKLEDQSSISNWSYSSNQNSSDSERTNSSENNRNEVTSQSDSHDSLLSKEEIYKNRLKDKATSSASSSIKLSNENKEMEISSSKSSEKNEITDDRTSNATSTESEVFFISSDESDEDISDLIFEPNYGSLTSFSTVSDGSLNSLLSQTVTEMASSTGTLTSIGLDRLPTPPPPPPAIIAASVKGEKTIHKNSLDKDHSIQNQVIMSPMQNSTKSSKKQSKSLQKISKPLKTEKIVLKNSTESSKNIFTSLVSMKSRTKEQNKLKCSKTNGMLNQPLFNMYGSSSPQNCKQLPSFIKENVSPVVEPEPKTCMQSFSSYQPQHELRTQSENKANFSNFEPKAQSNTNPQIHNLCSNSLGACRPEVDNVEVPLKYVHKVTITPIQRQSLRERNSSLLTCKKTLFEENNSQRIIDGNDFKRSKNVSTFYPPYNNNGDQFSNERPKPQRPMTLQPERPKAAARVLLDPEGRVVHCTNSLDRKLHYAVSTDTGSRSSHVGYSRNQGEVICNKNTPNYNQNSNFQPPTHAVYPFNEDMTNRRYSDISNLCSARYRPDTAEMIQIYPNFQSTSAQSYREISQPHKFIENNNYFHRTHAGVTCTQKLDYSKSFPGQQLQIPRKMPNFVTADPNISGLPLNETMLTQHNLNLHSKQMEKLNITTVSNTTANSTENYHASSQSPNSPLSTEVNKSQQSTMSTEDLFTVIHNCKKRMNIKTDSDISLASSSRSSSPSYLRPVSSKGALAETGFLSPRNLSSFDSRDRRSWADFRPSKDFSGEKKSLASDRLGPTKPTSMHDFKMLLLQTRSNSQVLGPRKSAVEMLKVPAPCDKDAGYTSVPISFSPQNSTSYSVPNSPSSEFYLCNGHSTVPFKRNHRARSTLQSRYTMYPPIFEDCSEDSENTRDVLPNNSATNVEAHKTPHMQPNGNSNLCEKTPQNIKHWV